ncbi:NAD-dependent aldehyde dehydrogenase [Clavulina sp. PMI_390]|nr:NAD-dependent aldehyde dehydrogenase [Clavulina sp. PMI_390]
MAPPQFTYDFSNSKAGFKGKSDFSLGLFIDNKWVDAVDGGRLDIVNPTSGKHLATIAGANEKDIDIAVAAAQKAYDTAWGLKASGTQRARLMLKLADLMEQNADELAALESLNNGKSVTIARNVDVNDSINCIRYYAGFADKIHGKTIETNDAKFTYTRLEPIGVVGQIVPWNFPLLMLAWKWGPALATGNSIVFKPSEWTPLTAIRMAELVAEAGFPPGVVNVVTGLGNSAGAAISGHMGIGKVAFTGSTLVGRHVMKAAAGSNLKKVTLELGGKSPTLIMDDSNLDEAVKWAAFGIVFNHGQTCCAGSRVFVHESAYDKFLEKFTEVLKNVKVGDPFEPETFQGPQVSQVQFDRIMNHISIGKNEGATCHLGGERHGTEGFFIQPTIFTDVKPSMTIIKEEIFGPVVAVAKFKDDDDIIAMANDTMYGLAAAVFTKDINKAITTANRIHSGTVWINEYNTLKHQVPFGGYKQSGMGRELGDAALENYLEVKSVHVNLSSPPPF